METAGENQGETDVIHYFLFADDCAHNDGTQSKMWESFDLFFAVCKDFGLTRSTKKTCVMYQPTHAVPYTEPTLRVVGEKLAVADEFTYLCSTLSRTVTNNEEVSYRIAHVSATYGRLQASLWERRGI